MTQRFANLQDIFSRGPAPTTGFISRATAQDRFNRAISAGGLTPFLESYLRNQFDPLFGAFSLTVPGASEAEGGPLGFAEVLRSGAFNPFLTGGTNPQIGQTARQSIQGRAGGLADLLSSTRTGQVANPAFDPSVEGSPQFIDVGGRDVNGTFEPLTGNELLDFNRFSGSPAEQFNAALTGSTFGVHPLFRGGTATALRRLFDQLGGEETGTPFLSAARTAGFF